MTNNEEVFQHLIILVTRKYLVNGMSFNIKKHKDHEFR